MIPHVAAALECSRNLSSRALSVSAEAPFNVTQSALCGMVVRGLMTGDSCTLRYVDMFDVGKLLGPAHEGTSTAFYMKIVAIPRGAAS
jgi:hypothetical protein